MSHETFLNNKKKVFYKSSFNKLKKIIPNNLLEPNYILFKIYY